MMRLFRKDENGFILVLALIVMPIFIGFGLLIIDMGRGNNAHADLYAAADSVALAGARELNGGPDAIARAKTAMANVTNSVSMLNRIEPGERVQLIYADEAGNEFQVVFLSDIPELDTTPITTAFLTANETTDDALAEYVYVRVQSNDMESAFLNPASLLRETVPIAAVAVAKALPDVICDVPPLYICNPFEAEGGAGDQLQTNFANGEFYTKLIKLHPKGSDTHAPGNFGFLSVDGTSSAKTIRDIFAGNTNPSCFSSETVKTKPGAANSISQGVNTRFDIYEGSFSNWNPNSPNSFPIGPAVNVRKGIKPDDATQCSGSLGDDHLMDSDGQFNANGVDDEVFGLPDNQVMTQPNQGVLGAFAGSGPWDAQNYLNENYGADPRANVSFIEKSFPLVPGDPSRYDVYRYEITEKLYKMTSPGGESGAALCGPSKPPNKKINPIPDPDRRVMVAAIIDCIAAGDGGGVNEYPVNSFASIFLTRPMISPGPGLDATIDVEIIDITGFGGNDTLDDFVRSEAVLVR